MRIDYQPQPGDRVYWHNYIPWQKFKDRYASHVAIVVAVHKNTIHIQVTRRGGTLKLKWVKRDHVSPCRIPDRRTAEWQFVYMGGYRNGR